MSTSAYAPQPGDQALGTSESASVSSEVADFWWLWLVVGAIWLVAAYVVLQFDQASITTIGIITGCMFAFAGCQALIVGMLADNLRWLRIAFGVFLLVAAVVCFINPEDTFAGLADILGILFLVVGISWTIDALVARDANPLWWLGLTSGILMLILAFWTSGQFFIEKAYTLLVLVGAWALMKGIADIIRAFQVRSLR